MGVNGSAGPGPGPSIKDISPRDSDAVGHERAAKMAEERHAAFISAMTARTQQSAFADWLTMICVMAVVIPLVIALWKWALS